MVLEQQKLMQTFNDYNHKSLNVLDDNEFDDEVENKLLGFFFIIYFGVPANHDCIYGYPLRNTAQIVLKLPQKWFLKFNTIKMQMLQLRI